MVNGNLRYGLTAVKDVGPAAVKAITTAQPFKDMEDFETRVPKRLANKKVKEALIAVGAFDRWGMRDGWSSDEVSLAERDRLGMQLVSDLVVHAEVVTKIETPTDEWERAGEDEIMVAVGDVVNIKEITTKTGKSMAFVDVRNNSDERSITCFDTEWRQFQDIIKSGKAIAVRGPKNRGGIIAKNLMTISDIAKANEG